MIRACRLGQSQHTPFHASRTRTLDFFRREGIDIVDTPDHCDLFVAPRVPPFWEPLRAQWKLLLRYRRKRPLFLWSEEPRHCLAWTRTLRWSRILPPAHVMNVYTGDLFTTNTAFLDWAVRKTEVAERTLAECPPPGQARMIALVTNRIPAKAVVRGVDRDLDRKRVPIVTEGHRRGRIDVVGEGWPPGVAREASRTGDWVTRKRELLTGYDVCFAIENTSYDYYCTEKIWQAIEGGCLPVYWSAGTRIHETFPQRSFVDASLFGSPAAVIDFIDAMPRAEFQQRFNRCVAAYNATLARTDARAEREAMHRRVASRIRRIVGA